MLHPTESRLPFILARLKQSVYEAYTTKTLSKMLTCEGIAAVSGKNPTGI